MKTDVDTVLKDIADWYVKNRRPMSKEEFKSIIQKLPDEKQRSEFNDYLYSNEGIERFKTLLRERKGVIPSPSLRQQIPLNWYEIIRQEPRDGQPGYLVWNYYPSGWPQRPTIEKDKSWIAKYTYQDWQRRAVPWTFETWKVAIWKEAGKPLEKLSYLKKRPPSGKGGVTATAFFGGVPIKVGDKVKSRVWTDVRGEHPWLTVKGIYVAQWMGKSVVELEVTDGIQTNRVFEDTIIGHEQPQLSKGERKFPLGQIVMTRGVNDLVATNTEFSKFVTESLGRHSRGDWGDLPPEDKRENEFALTRRLRLFSAYEKPPLPKIWIITEADRSVTTILFPSEY